MDRDGENYVLRYREGHRWWYFPRMTSGEIVLLKTYGSEVDGRARFIGHSAFDDPDSAEGAAFRETEVRTIAFF